MTEAKATSKETMTNPETVTNLEAMGTLAKQAERALRIAGEAEKTKALELIAEALIRRTPRNSKSQRKRSFRSPRRACTFYDRSPDTDC